MIENEIKRLYDEYLEILKSQVFYEEDLDYSVLDRHIPMLKMMDVIESSSLYIMDMNKRDYVYVSPRFTKVFGFDIEEAYEEGPSFLDRRVHPEDMLNMLKAGNHFMKYGLSLPPEERLHGKLVVDYRLKNAKDEYLRVIKQHIPLEHDKHGNLWLVLCIIDISPDQDLEAPFRCRLINVKTGELMHFPNEEEFISKEKELLSGREKEILKLIASGLASKQIADKLYISVNTVNTHRQRIIEKLNVSNTFEAIKYASDFGLIS